jgi:hypothetical protein
MVRSRAGDGYQFVAVGWLITGRKASLMIWIAESLNVAETLGEARK